MNIYTDVSAIIIKPPVLQKSFGCTGTVLNEQGDTLANATVHFYKRSFSNQPWVLKSTFITISDGKYSIWYVRATPEDIFGDPDFFITISFRPNTQTKTFDFWSAFNAWNTSIDPTQKWWGRTFTSEASVLSYLNNGYYNYPVAQAKILAK